MNGLPDVPPGIENQANAALDWMVAELATIQPGYISSNDKYFQGIISSNVPQNGNTMSPDWARKPSDQQQSWADVGINSNTPRVVCFECHIHNGPAGVGYTVLAHIEIAGQHYTKCAGVGPGSTTHDWVEVDNDFPT